MNITSQTEVQNRKALLGTSLKSKARTQGLRMKKGFTLIEIISVLILVAVLGGIGFGYMRDTTQTGRANVLQKNADELNNVVTNLLATGAVFQTGATVNGTATAPARIQLNSTPSVTEKNTFITSLEGAGFTSMGITASLAKNITEASYVYTWDSARNRPVFAVASGATEP